MINEIVMRCNDVPDANGRVPQKGERMYTLIFPLEGGNKLKLECGEETFKHFSDMLGRMAIDDFADNPKERIA